MNKRSKAVSTVMIVAVILSIGMLLAPGIVSAASGPKNVRGTVWQNNGSKLVGADVTVNIRWASDDSIRSTLSDTTDGNGFYSVTFAPALWDIGDRIEVISTFSTKQESNSTGAISAPVQYINVTYTYEIPVFDSIWGFAIAGGALAVVGVALLAWKKK